MGAVDFGHTRTIDHAKILREPRCRRLRIVSRTLRVACNNEILLVFQITIESYYESDAMKGGKMKNSNSNDPTRGDLRRAPNVVILISQTAGFDTAAMDDDDISSVHALHVGLSLYPLNPPLASSPLLFSCAFEVSLQNAAHLLQSSLHMEYVACL